MRKLRIAVFVLLFFWLCAESGKFLIVDSPRKSDAILVLAGETDHRPDRGVELLAQGYAGRVVLDVPAGGKIYGSTFVELAQKWADSLPQASAIVICPIHGLSTKAEALDAADCLRKSGGSSTLLVTSDFHMRRALSVFRHQIPGRTFEGAAAYDATQFGAQWWRHRQWAKTNLDEWLRLLWWQLVDRWF